jgi:hypothetical protein
MEHIKNALAKYIGGPIWRLVQTTTHSTLGAAVVIWLVIFVGVAWVAI